MQTTGTQQGDIAAGYIKDGVYQGQPSVQPNPSNPNSLKGTMTTQPPTGGTTPSTGGTTPPTGSFADMMQLQGVLATMENKVNQNNALMGQRNLVLKALYDQPLTPQELSTLDPSLQKAIQSGDRNQIDMQLRLISDQVSGRTQTLDQSVNYLLNNYQSTIQQAESNKQAAITTVLNYAKALNQKPSVVMKALYPQLADQLGTQLDTLSAPLLTSTQVAPIPGSTITIPSGTIASRTNNPLNIKYSPTSVAGGSDSGIQAQDGGTFASFASPEEGLAAAVQLLQSPNYANLTVEQAMNRWSNNGYGAEVSNIPGNTLMSDLNPEQLNQLVTDMARRESGAQVSFAQSAEVLGTPPDPATANKVDPTTNLTPNGLWNAALEYAFTGKMPSLGLGSAAQVRSQRTAIINKAGAIADAMGSNFPQIQAMYKANSSAATKFVTQALFVKTYLATATDNLDLALQASQNVPRTGAKMANKYALWAQGEYTPAGPLATFETYIYTAAREYAKVTSGGAMSAAGLTDSARQEADKLLNSAQSPEAFAATVNAMKKDMANVVGELDKTVSGVTKSLGIQSPNSPTDITGIKSEVQSIASNKSAYSFKTREDIINALVSQGVDQKTAEDVVYSAIPDGTPNW